MSVSEPLRAGDPRRLGRYAVTGRLGSGGQGVVYLAVDAAGRQVAVKVLRTDLLDSRPARVRFAKEVAAARRVARFCTAQVLDFDVNGDHPYVVSEYVPGPSLQRLVAQEGPRRGGALERLAISTATALVAIHDAGIVHRDFKPANVLLGPDGARVVDFGLARALDATVTMSGHLMGTPAYMAPEHFGGAGGGSGGSGASTGAAAIGPPADVWAWAVTVGYAATGVPAFGDDSAPAIMRRVLDDPPALGTPETLPVPLRDVIAACLRKDPAVRPTAREVLDRLLAGEASAGDAPARAGLRRRMLPTAVAAVGLSLAGGVALLREAMPGEPSGVRAETPRTGGPDAQPAPPPVRRPRPGRLGPTRTRLVGGGGPLALVRFHPRKKEVLFTPRYDWVPETGRFRKAENVLRTELMSPDGRWVAEMLELSDTPRLSIVDRISGGRAAVDLPDRMHYGPRWSPDSRRLLLTALSLGKGNLRPGYVVVDVGETPAAHPVDADGGTFYWNADATGVVTNLPADKGRAADARFYDLKGHPTGSVPEVGRLADNGLGPVAPSGGLLLTYCEEHKESTVDACTWDIATGERRSLLSFGADGARPVNEVLGWYDDEHILTSHTRDGKRWSVAVRSVTDPGAPYRPIAEGPDDAFLYFARVPA